MMNRWEPETTFPAENNDPVKKCILLELYEEAFARFAAGSVDFGTNADEFLTFLQVVREVRAIFDQRLLKGGTDRISDLHKLEHILGRIEEYLDALPYGYWRISSSQPLLRLLETLAVVAYRAGDLHKFLSRTDASKCRELLRTIVNDPERADARPIL